ncbi:MAG: permease [Candidatus Hydrogenedentes bacterium]|nr:permease [Candidatus Hydrogenedentota bacterium]
MNWKKEIITLIYIIIIFFLCYFLPVGTPRFDNSVIEALHLLKWYAREHVLLCLVPAFFIAGAISVFVNQSSILKYLGPNANKIIAYGVSSISGTILAVCSCTVLPLFTGIYKMGAGLGPATAFLYSGPAINVLAIILTARILGIEIGIARAVGAVLFSILVGLLMQIIFSKEEKQRTKKYTSTNANTPSGTFWKSFIFFASMIAILMFSNWGKPNENDGIWNIIYQHKWHLTSISGIIFGLTLSFCYGVQWWKTISTIIICSLAYAFFPNEPTIPFTVGVIAVSIIALTGNAGTKEWIFATWTFAKQILPLLLGGVLIAGSLLGRPGHEGIIPNAWVYKAVGGNSIRANFLASMIGAFMYFATLTEVPILQGLLSSGMGKGPALALLLAGPALSLPSMLVLYTILGFKKTFTYILLVILLSTLAGVAFGTLF